MSKIELNNTWAKLFFISKCAKENKRYKFMSLAPYLNIEFLKDCYNSLDRNKAVRIDNVNHDMLIEFLNIRIKDSSLIFLRRGRNVYSTEQ